jgi:hypothetical protein
MSTASIHFFGTPFETSNSVIALICFPCTSTSIPVVLPVMGDTWGGKSERCDERKAEKRSTRGSRSAYLPQFLGKELRSEEVRLEIRNECRSFTPLSDFRDYGNGFQLALPIFIVNDRNIQEVT